MEVRPTVCVVTLSGLDVFAWCLDDSLTRLTRNSRNAYVGGCEHREPVVAVCASSKSFDAVQRSAAPGCSVHPLYIGSDVVPEAASETAELGAVLQHAVAVALGSAAAGSAAAGSAAHGGTIGGSTGAGDAGSGTMSGGSGMMDG